GGEKRIEATLVRGRVVLVENGLNDLSLAQPLAGFRSEIAFRPEVVHVETENVPVLDCVGDRIGVELALEKVLGGKIRRLVAGDLSARSVFFKDGRAGEAEELRVGKELLDCLVVFAELRTVTLVEDEHEPFGRKGRKAGPIVALVIAAEGQTELLYGCDDDLVGFVLGEQPAY